MPRTLHRLTPLRVSKLTGAGLYADGGGHYLQVSSPTAKSWVFRYQLNGSVHKIGLGSASGIPLAEARDLAHACRNLKAKGIDPKARRAEERAAPRKKSRPLAQCPSSTLKRTADRGETQSTAPIGHRPWRPMRSPSSATCPSATLQPRTSISFLQRSSTKRQRLPRGCAVGSRIFSATPPPLDIGWGITRPDGRGTLSISCRRDLKFKKFAITRPFPIPTSVALWRPREGIKAPQRSGLNV